MNDCMECWEAILPHTVRHPPCRSIWWGSCSTIRLATPVPCTPGAVAGTCTWCPIGRCRADSIPACGSLITGRDTPQTRTLPEHL